MGLDLRLPAAGLRESLRGDVSTGKRNGGLGSGSQRRHNRGKAARRSETDRMQARVRLFAIARERAGCSFIEVDLPDAATVLDLKTALGRKVPSLVRLLPTIRFSVNAEYADDTTAIPSGAELAAIPPVSGGEDSGPSR